MDDGTRQQETPALLIQPTTIYPRTAQAKPNRLLTLTVDPSGYKSPREAFDLTRRQIPRLFHHLRKKFGSIEYLRVTELTKNGWPHYHFLIRSKYIPHKVIRDKWLELTGAKIVDIRQVKEHFKAYQYLAKYLSKMHKLAWTERHVSTSRNFFPQETRETPPIYQLDEPSFIPMHPCDYLHEYHQGRVLKIQAPNLGTLHDTTD